MTTEELGEQRARELGLKVFSEVLPTMMDSRTGEMLAHRRVLFYHANAVDKLLGEGVEVENPSDDRDTACQRWSISEYSIKGYGKQQGLLIGRRPIKPPSLNDTEIKAKIDQINKLSKEIEALLEKKP